MTKVAGAPQARAVSNGPGLRSLGEAVAVVARPLLAGRRAPLAELRAAWGAIAGERLAAVSQPYRLVMPPRQRTHGILHLQIASGAVGLEVQHAWPLLVERINACLGYAAIARLKLSQAPVSMRPSPPPRAIVNGAPASLAGGRTALAVSLDGITNPRLRETLAGLARSLAAADSHPATADDWAPACPADPQAL